MKRVALYARVSTEEQVKHGYSIGAQVNALRDYAHDNGYAVVGEYLDEGISGRKSYKKRAALMRLLGDVQNDQIDIVLFCKLDRWFRSVQAYYQIQPILEAHNVAWQAIQEDYETVTASGRFKVNIMLSVAENEADRTAERIRFVQDVKRANGEPLNTKAPFGYVYDHDNKRIVEDPDTIDAARDIFKWYINTRSTFGTRDKLFEVYGIQRTYKTIRTILMNPFYIDLVGQETFQKTQEILLSRSQRNSRTGSVFLFSGMMFCRDCGSRLKGSRVDGVAYYSCYRHGATGNAGCTNKRHLPEHQIENYLLMHVEDAIRDYNVKIMRNSAPPIDKDKIRRKMAKLKDLYLEDLISKEVYERDYRALEKDLNAYEPALKTIAVDDVRAALSKYRRLTKASQKAFWGRILKRIEMDSDGNLFLIP